MYNVTQAFIDAIKQNGRQFKSSVTIRDTTFDDNSIIEIGLEENTNPTESFMLGGVGSSKLDITLINIPEALILEDANVTATISLLVNGVYEDVPLGVFTVDDVSKDKNVVKLPCYDNMIKLEKAYFSDLIYPTDINNVANEICAKAGVQLATVLPNIQIDKIDGYTCREAIGFIASFLGGFARFNRQGKLEILSYVDSGFSITSDNYFPGFKTAESLFTIGKLTCKVGDSILTVGTNGNEIQFENPIMTQAQLDSIYNTLKNLSYMPYNMSWQGNQALQAGDKITITDLKGNTYNTLLMDNKITYKGGLNGTASAVGKTETGQNFNSSGTMKNSIDRMVIEQANIKVLLAEKATIEDLTATIARIDNLSSTYATIVNLNATTARIATLETNSATIIQLNATNANITDLQANKASVTDLTAATGRISSLESNTASINSILAGNIGVANLQAGLITATSGLIANAAISSAMIISLAVSQLQAGDISTTKFRLVSDAGNLLMSDNTIQIKDATRVRVQIGKDASNDYNMYVWDAGGNLMFDALGLKASGIKDKIIVDNMVSDTANIDAKKLNITTLFSQMNGSSQTLKATRIYLDTQAQTLDVAFTSLNSTVTTQGTTITSQGTSISTIQGQITSKVWSADITTAINNIQIGGRNLIVYSKLSQYTGGTINADYKTGIITGSGTYYIKLPSAGLKPSTQYIISNTLIDNPNSNTVGKVQIVIYDSTITTNKQTVGYLLSNGTLVFTTASTILSTDVLLIYTTTTQSTTYTIKSLKLEVGTKATDWTPSPEDVQGQIDATNTNISTNYSTTTQTNNLISTQVSSVSTDLHTNYSTTTAMNTAISTSANGVLSTVSSTYATISAVNSKSKVFTSQPVPPYNVGDLWVTSNSAGDSLVCTTARATGSYTASDWTKDSISQRMGSAESSISQNAGNIALKVNTIDYNGNNIASLINQSATTISISASKIDLSGYVTISSLGANGTTTINGNRISGGVLTLGGANNSYGYINMLDSTGTLMGWWSGSGLATYTGLVVRGGIQMTTGSVIGLDGTTNGTYIGCPTNGNVNITIHTGASIILDGQYTSVKSNLTVASNITWATVGALELGQVNIPTGGFYTALHMSSIINAGYRQHISVGAYRTGSAWGGGLFVGLGGSDSNPTNYWLFDYGGGITYSGVSYITFNSSILTYGNVYTSRVIGSVTSNDYFYIGTGNCRIDCTGGTARFQADGSNYISIDSGGLSVYIGGTNRFSVSSSGTKTGGTINIDGTTYGMAPVDSPRQVIEDFYLNIWVDTEGTIVQLNPIYARSVAEYGVWPSNADAKVISKDATSFVIKGYTGIIDIRVVGYRKDSLDYYYPVMDSIAA